MLGSKFREAKDRVSRRVDSSFFRNVGKLAGGSAAAHVITLACSPILTRLYPPEAFGLLGVFAAVALFVVHFATLKFDLVLVLPKEDSRAWNLLQFTGAWSFVAVFILFGLLFPLRVSLAEALGTPGLASLFIWLPLLVLGGAWLNLAWYWAIRKKRFGELSKTSVSSSIFVNGLKIGGGFLGFGGGFLIIATFLQRVFHFTSLLFSIRKDLPQKRYDSAEGRRLVREYKNFPLYRMPQDTMASISSNLPNILLAAYFSPAIVGFYLLAHRVTQSPANLLREAVRNVFYQKATEMYHQHGDLYRSVVKMTSGLAGLSLPLAGILLFFGEPLFVFLFGPEWSAAGIYAKYIGILVITSVANTPSVVIVTVLGKNKGLLIYESCATVSRVATLCIGGLYWTAEETIAAFCLVSAFANLCLITGVLYYLKKWSNNIN